MARDDNEFWTRSIRGFEFVLAYSGPIFEPVGFGSIKNLTDLDPDPGIE